MWLIDTSTYRRSWHIVDDTATTPQYAILSHTWGQDEVSFNDLEDLSNASKKQAFSKVEYTCREARARGLQYSWIDTCCIDKRSSGELSEAINSMFNWYQKAAVCFIYLDDLDVARAKEKLTEGLSRCKWFTRGWTLQELIAPREAELFDRGWKHLGSKRSLLSTLSDITNINRDVLEDANYLSDVPIARRMSWAARRKTRRVEISPTVCLASSMSTCP